MMFLFWYIEFSYSSWRSLFNIVFLDFILFNKYLVHPISRMHSWRSLDFVLPFDKAYRLHRMWVSLSRASPTSTGLAGEGDQHIPCSEVLEEPVSWGEWTSQGAKDHHNSWPSAEMAVCVFDRSKGGEEHDYKHTGRSDLQARLAAGDPGPHYHLAKYSPLTQPLVLLGALVTTLSLPLLSFLYPFLPSIPLPSTFASVFLLLFFSPIEVSGKVLSAST